MPQERAEGPCGTEVGAGRLPQALLGYLQAAGGGEPGPVGGVGLSWHWSGGSDSQGDSCRLGRKTCAG